MARSRSLAECLLISCMFMLLLICLDKPKSAMGYDLLLVVVFPCPDNITLSFDFEIELFDIF